MSANNVAGYIRISKATEGSLSLQSQIAQINAYANSNGLIVTEWHSDNGVSAKSLDRPALNSALDSVRSGKVNGLICANISRISRVIADVELLLARDFRNSKLIIADMNVDASTPQGKLVINVLSSIYAFERNNLIYRTKNALKVKMENKEFLGAPNRQQYGFDVVGKKLVENEREQNIIKFMMNLRNQGLSYAAICRKLSADGYKNRMGKDFSPMAVRTVVMRNAQQSIA